MTITITPTVQAGNVPPRVKLNVVDSSGAVMAVTVVRTNPDGTQIPVRTSDGGALPLGTATGTRIGLLYDYEMPLGVPVTYSTVEDPGTVTAAVAVSSPTIWLSHPGIPALSIPIELRSGSLADETWDVDQAIFWPMGGTFPIVQTSGARRAPQSSLTVAVDTLSQLAALRAITADASILFLNVPPNFGFGLNPCYIAPGAIKASRLTTVGADPYRNVEIPFQIVARPGGGTQPQWTWASVKAQNTTWAALRARYATWYDVKAGS